MIAVVSSIDMIPREKRPIASEINASNKKKHADGTLFEQMLSIETEKLRKLR